MTRVFDHALTVLIDNAKLASGDKKVGDRWSQNHGYVVGHSPNRQMGAHYTVCHPTYDRAGELMGYPTFKFGRSSDLSRHIAGCSPATIIMLCTELQELRAKAPDVEAMIDKIMALFNQDRVAFFDDEERENSKVKPLRRILNGEQAHEPAVPVDDYNGTKAYPDEN